MRRELVEAGIYFFPLAMKQCSISAAHTADDIAMTLEALRKVFSNLDAAGKLVRKRDLNSPAQAPSA